MQWEKLKKSKSESCSDFCIIFEKMLDEEEFQTEDETSIEQLAKNWLPAYTWVLIANAVYILIFLLIMKIFE